MPRGDGAFVADKRRCAPKVLALNAEPSYLRLERGNSVIVGPQMVLTPAEAVEAKVRMSVVKIPLYINISI